ncbi:hypothetical protein [Curvivirga sp.]|uniref:hypothetical protein n=1 Tax=Curvivirga sp. TaxID=2856848 RepID=UPI003B5AC1B6
MFYQIIGHDQTISNVFKRLLVLLGLLTLAACAPKFAHVEGIPSYEGVNIKKLSVATVDRRDFILNGNKEPWFEGITRAGFGVPHSLRRESEPENQSFAMYLSLKVQDSLKGRGSNVEVVSLEAGTDKLKSVQALVAEGNPALLIEINHSRYDCCFSLEYRYDFDVSVIRANGELLFTKKFAHWYEDMEVDETRFYSSGFYDVFGIHAQKYADLLTEFLNDTEIQAALARAEN